MSSPRFTPVGPRSRRSSIPAGDVFVSDPRERELDPEIRTPHTDQYSIGLDREVGRRLAVSVVYIRKDGRDFIGWTEVAGQYLPQTATLTNGRDVQVLRLVTPPNDRIFRLTNPEGYSLKYNGLVIAVENRRARGWQAFGSYTLSRAVRAPAFERDDRRRPAGRHRGLPARHVCSRGHVRAGSERSHQRQRPPAQRSSAHAPGHGLGRRATHRLRDRGQPAASQRQTVGEDGAARQPA